MNRKSGDFRNSNNNNNNNNNNEIENENEKGIANRIFTLFPQTFARFQNINLDIATVLKEVCLNAALNFSQLNLEDNKTDLKKIDSELKIFVEKSFDFTTKKGDIPTFKTMDQNISGRLRDLAGRQSRKDAESRSTRHGENGGGRPRPPLQTSMTIRPSATLAHAAGPSTTSANVAGPSTSFCNVAGPSTSSANVGGPSTSLFNVVGPSTSFCNVGAINSAPRTTTQKTKRYLCPKIFGCNKKYNRNGDMLLHLNNSHCNHPEFSKWGIQCTHPKCNYRCESAMSLKSHSPVHDRQCKKVQPGRPTSDPLSLSGPNKQYFCKYCNLSYCRTSDLIRHLNKIHPKEAKKDQPNLVCKTCGRVLLDPKSLQKHRAIVHGSTKKGQKRVNDNDDDDDDGGGVDNTMPPRKKLRFSQDVEITDDDDDADDETTSSTNSDTTKDENASATSASDDQDKGAHLETENEVQENDSSADEEEEDEEEDREEENEQVSSTVTPEKPLKSILSQNNDDDSDEDEDEDYDKTLSIFPNPFPSPPLPPKVQKFGRFLNSPKIILIDLTVTTDGSSGSENETVDETVAKVFNQEIKRSSLDRLDGCTFLNEDLIDAYLNILASKKDGVVAVSTRFYPKVKYTFFDALKRAENSNLFNFSTILVPIHKGGAHWCLAVVEMNGRKIFYFDSMRKPNTKCLENLESFFFSLRGIQHVEKINDQEMPMQINEYDCGVYVCKYAQVYVQNLSRKFTPEDITKFRQEIKNDILFHGRIPID